jgi:diguanylate cyclase (GGDEF)-like protein/PAS domain S-box-containing protein
MWIGMSDRTARHGGVIDEATMSRTVDALLARDPEAFVSTLNDHGFAVPAPDSFDLDVRRVTWRNDRTLMVDVVIPADRLAVIATWERARGVGMASANVRLASDPRSVMTLTIVDMRHRYGVLLAIFTHDDSTAETAPVHVAQTIAPLRPRTVTIRKGMLAIITGIDDHVTKLLGWPGEMIVGRRSSEFIHPDDQERAIENWMQMLATETGQRVRFRHRCLDGTWLWVEVDNEYHHSDDPDDIEVVAHVTDISDEMAAHQAVQEREELFRRLAESLPIGLFQVQTDRTIAYANARVAEILGIPAQATLADQLSTVITANRPALDRAFDDALGQGVDSEIEVQIRHPGSGQVRLCELKLVALATDSSTPGAIVTVNDVTDSARLRDELRIMATFDPLTRCYTRRAFLAALDQLLDGPDRDGVGVVFIDLDNFKPVNDRLGHAAGDELLEHAADAIRQAVRDGDIVGRIGGDEFIVACRNIGWPDGALIVERVRAALTGTVALSTGAVELRASIGVACVADDTTREALIAQADAAMYESKRGRQGVPVLHGHTALLALARAATDHESGAADVAQSS